MKLKRWLTVEIRTIVLLFAVWRIWITVFAMLAIEFVPLRSQHLLGGSYSSYIMNPLLWGWANFDGEHYLAIAQHGYERLTHSFFPVYPIVVRLFALPFEKGLFNLNLAGLFVSNAFFLASLVLFWKLVCLDYSKKVARLSALLLVSFPTSFYFGSVYTESLFLFCVVGSFYFARRGSWWFAGILGGIASGVRVVGIFLLPALVIELWPQRKMRSLLALSLVPVGLLAYMLFLWKTTGSPLTFYTELSTFGVQREGNLILLPQVFYRYIKMLVGASPPNVLYFIVVVEFISAVLSVLLLAFSLMKKIRLSYIVFSFLAFILPTFTGSFSSLPRYLLVIFPFFIVMPLFLEKRTYLRVIAIFVSVCLLIAETILFSRGYWVA